MLGSLDPVHSVNTFVLLLLSRPSVTCQELSDTQQVLEKSFRATSFHYDIEKMKKNDSWLGPLSVWSLHILLMCVGFLLGLRFLPHPKGAHVR